MKAFKNSGILLLFAILTVGCATTGPTYSEMSDSMPSLSSEMGRIYIYRTSVFGAALQPGVVLNGEVVGKAVPNGFFYVDCPAGNHEIVTSTEVERELSFTLDKGEIRYVRLDVSIGFFVGHVYPNLIESEVAESEISKCHYIGE
jgi:hypothetical protein